ncbi:MAG TPA: PIN domain-containing protein [Xanthomonadaceae bacterium]|nr:PIN domain-containing protein [Xanthomonadaceae bacterium]
MSAEFVDTNVVLYSLSDDVAKRRRALAILVDRPVLSLQVLNEAANIMRRKLGFAIPAIREVVLRWMGESRFHPLAPSTLLSALDVAERYGFSHYDSLIIAAALEAGCATLYSEDLQHGQVIDQRLTIINPFT